MAKHRPKIKNKEILSDFKNFILRGNVMDLAVGVIIGGAFNKIVTSLVNDIIMPCISVIVGTGHFDAWYVSLDGVRYPSLEAAVAAEAPLFKFGSFISTVLDFLLMGLAVFLLVKLFAFVAGKLKRDKPAEPEAPSTKACPFCISQIHIDATVCPQCTSRLEP